MEAGRLRERITIQQLTRVSNGQGGWSTGWVDVATKVTARVVALTGDEAIKLGIERSSVQYRISIRKRRGLTAKNRLTWNGQTLEVRSVLPDPAEPNSMLLLLCETLATAD